MALSNPVSVSRRSLLSVGALSLAAAADTTVFSAACPSSGITPQMAELFQRVRDARAALDRQYERISTAIRKIESRTNPKIDRKAWERIGQIEATDKPFIEAVDDALMDACEHPASNLLEIVEKIRLARAEKAWECTGGVGNFVRESVFADIMELAGLEA